MVLPSMYLASHLANDSYLASVVQHQLSAMPNLGEYSMAQENTR
ncbi:hypothetical protein [Nostoc sp. ChiQUE01b]|nr:hypothetical protein [Nostoc sp. ChiQUE01b]